MGAKCTDPSSGSNKDGILAMSEWARLRARCVRNRESVVREPSEQDYVSCHCRKAAWSHQYLQDSVVLSLFKVQRKEKCRRPKGGGSRMQESHTVLWSWAVLHSWRVIPFCMLWLTQVSRWFWVILKDKFYIAHTSSSTYGSIPCSRKELVSFFCPRDELLNGRA